MRRAGKRWVLGVALCALLGACVGTPPAPAGDPVQAAFVVLGADGQPVVRAITAADVCPLLTVDGALQPMTVRALPGTVARRPTASAPLDSKPAAFPVLVCDALLATTATEASLGSRTLQAPKPDPRRIVVIGDTGCRLKRSEDTFQACNNPVEWPFAQVAAAAAAAKPDLVVHLGDFQYRENPCPEGDAGCRGSPWGYGWDAWDADFFTPARPLLAAAPWVVVRGNHESCDRAGQGWWRFLDPRRLAPGRDCNDPADDGRGDYSDPYPVPVGRDTQLIVFDSSNVPAAALAPSESMYRIYDAQLRQAFALAAAKRHSFLVNHHPILGLAPNPSPRQPDRLYRGNQALQSVLEPIDPQRLFPPAVEALLAGHYHLFEAAGFATAQPAQLVSGNGGAVLYPSLPLEAARATEPAPGAQIETIASSSRYGFMVLERDGAGSWRVEARDTRGRTFTTCTLRGRELRCLPEARGSR